MLCIILSGGDCPMFSAGIDLGFLSNGFVEAGKDVGRQALDLDTKIAFLQDAAGSIQKCVKPVIGVAHGTCIGAGLEVFTCCDIRLTTYDCKFSIREIRVGLAADVGALQRVPKLS